MATPSSDYRPAPGPGKPPRDVEPVFIADADHLARAVDTPASESGPLFRLMFPRPSVDFSEQQKDEIIRWHAEGIKDAITGSRTYLGKIRHGDGTVVGLAGWVVEPCPEEQASSNKNRTAVEAAKVGSERKSEYGGLPGTLDVSAWLKVSAVLKKERHSTIGHLDNVCRITIMSIRPEYQRQGHGTMLMQHICEDVDRHGRYGYVLASPAGVRLYSKFGFEAVGQVDTPYGPITSMLRWRHGRAFSLDQRRLSGRYPRVCTESGLGRSHNMDHGPSLPVHDIGAVVPRMAEGQADESAMRVPEQGSSPAVET